MKEMIIVTERERLVELLKNDNCPSPFVCDANCTYINSENCLAERMADYLLENGVIVLPCKVGDMVYIFERGSYIIPICGQGKPHWEIKIEKCSFKYWLLDNHKFGENMFFTREEAEKALKEREQK